jgi:hypothetical protein
MIIKQYFYNLAVCISQLLSTTLGGEPDVSISQRTAQAYLFHGKGTWWEIQMNLIDFIVFWEKNHCLNSIKGEKNTRTLWKWDK